MCEGPARSPPSFQPFEPWLKRLQGGVETGSRYFTKVLKSLWSRSRGLWNNPDDHPCSPSFSKDCWKVNALVREWRQGRIVFRKQLSQECPWVQARFPSSQVHTRKHTCEFISSNPQTNVIYPHLLYSSVTLVVAILHLVENSMHKEFCQQEQKDI